MARRQGNIASSSQARAQARRVAERNNPTVKPNVSYEALLSIVDRECEKQGRRWYGVPSAKAVIQEIRESDPPTRKEARQMMLAKIDAFPLVQA